MKKRNAKLLSLLTSGVMLFSQFGTALPVYAAPGDDEEPGDILEEKFYEEMEEEVIEENEEENDEVADFMGRSWVDQDEDIVFGASQSESETNNSLEAASRIDVNSPATGRLSNTSDKDWYKFTIQDAGYVSVSFSHDYIDSHTNYWNLVLYTSDNTRLMDTYEFYGDEIGNCKTGNVGLPAGTYYVRVISGSNWSDAQYAFTVNYTKSAVWEQELNNSLSIAQRIPVNTTISGSITNGGTDDWYKFSIEKDSTISADFSHSFVDKHISYWTVRLCDEAGNRISEILYSYGDDKKVISTGDINVKAGTYYFRVHPNYSNEISDVDYSFKINDSSSSTPTTPENPTPSTPTPSTPTPSTPTPSTPTPGTGFVDGPAPRLKYDSTGELHCYVNYVRDDSYTGLALYYSGGKDYFVYVENGKRNETYSGYVEYNGGVFYVAGGTLADYLNGLVQDPNYPRDWYYLANGQKQAQYTGLAYYDGEWFYVTDGWLNTEYTAYTSYDGGLFYVAAGRIASEVSGLAMDPNGTEWYYLANGQAQTQYTGLAFYDSAWFYVKNGRLAQEYSGPVMYDGAYFYVDHGMLR